MSQTLVERTTEIKSQRRIYTNQDDREEIPVDHNQCVFVEITETGEGVKGFADMVVKFHDDGEFFIPSNTMEELDLEVGDEVRYRIF